MESRTYIKNLKISPKKLRLLLPEIKKLTPKEAVKILMYANTKSARIFYKAIKSAISNAKNVLKTDEDLLKFKTLLVEEGPRLKRFRPGSKGRATPYVRRLSHIKVVLMKDEGVEKNNKNKKNKIKLKR